MERKPCGKEWQWSLEISGFQKLRADSSQPLAKHFNSQSCNREELSGKVNPFLVGPLDNDLVLVSTGEKTATPG